METIKKFEYKGKEITFQLGNGDTMVNATEMAKSFGKFPNDWLRLPSTASFLEALEQYGKIPQAENQAIRTIKGGLNPGTWMHEDVAIEFARWLSPEFAIWCNDRIKELMKHGATAINPEDLLNPDYVISVMQALKKEREEKAILEAENNRNKPLVDFANTVADSSDTIDMGEFAKLAYPETGIGRTRLFRYLRDQKILNKKNVPYQKFIDAGWFKVVEQPFETPYGTKINIKTLVTGRGQISIVEKIRRENNEKSN